MTEMTTGEFGGIGVVVTQDKDDTDDPGYAGIRRFPG